jgi:hypothetical protein
LPVYYNDNILTPAGNPFRLDTTGKPRYFETKITQYDTLLLSDVKMLNKVAVNAWSARMLGGIFEASNNSDFSDSVRLHTINKLPDGMNYNTVKLRNTSKFRYIRYLPPAKSYCNVSEIGIYGIDGQKLTGAPTGIQSANPKVMNIKHVFDDNLATFYDVKDAWVGLDLGEPKHIKEIRYFPRNDHFEVWYWNGTQWQSLGKLDVENKQLKTPSGALLRIKNADQKERQDNRVFYLHNGFQQIN